MAHTLGLPHALQIMPFSCGDQAAQAAIGGPIHGIGKEGQPLHCLDPAADHRTQFQRLRFGVDTHHARHGVGIGNPDCIIAKHPRSAHEVTRVGSPAQEGKTAHQPQFHERRAFRRIDSLGADDDMRARRSERLVGHQANSPCRNHSGSPPRSSPNRPWR